MANSIFKGFKMVASGYTGFTPDYLYFVRTNKDSKDGYLQFNNKQYGTAQDVADDIKGLIGTIPSGSGETVVAYIQNGIQEAKNYADAQSVNGKSGHTITLNGGDIKLDGYAKAASKGAIATGDTVNAALGKLEKGLEEAIAGGLQSVEAGNGISVSEVANNKQTISAKVKSDEKVLAASASGLSTTLSISYNSSDRKIYLKGINDAEVSSFDASAFVKDGMLYGQKVFKATATTQTVVIKEKSHEFTNLTVGHTYLAMCFSNGEATGTTYSWDVVDVTDLVDVYTAGNGLQLSNGEFSIKLATGNESFLTVDANGLKLDGVQSAIDTAKNTVSGLVATEEARAKGVEGALSSLTTDAKDSLVSAINEVDSHADANTTAIGVLNGDASTAGSVKKQIKDAIEDLDAVVSGKNASEQIVVTVAEVDGKLTGVTVSASKFDLDGAAATAKSELLDGASTDYNTLKKLEDKVKANANAITAETAARESAISAVTTAITAVDERVDSAFTVIEKDELVTASALTNLDGRVTVLEGLSGQSHTHDNKTVLDGITSAKVSAWDAAEANAKAYTDSAITALDATVSGASHDVKVTVAEVDGKLTGVTVEAPDFASLYDAKGAADTAEANAKGYADSAISSAIAALDATVTGSSSGITVTVTETDGKLTAATAALAISASDNNAVVLKDDGIFAAIYYEDLDV